MVGFLESRLVFLGVSWFSWGGWLVFLGVRGSGGRVVFLGGGRCSGVGGLVFSGVGGLVFLGGGGRWVGFSGEGGVVFFWGRGRRRLFFFLGGGLVFFFGRGGGEGGVFLGGEREEGLGEGEVGRLVFWEEVIYIGEKEGVGWYVVFFAVSAIFGPFQK